MMSFEIYEDFWPDPIEPIESAITPIVPDRFAGRPSSEENYNEAAMIMSWLDKLKARHIAPTDRLGRIAVNNPIDKRAPEPTDSRGYY